ASQAVGPPGNNVEMSADGRSLRDIGKKLLSLRPLQRQHVDPTDSVLGPLADSSGKGLNISYDTLVRSAFQPRLWAGHQLVQVHGGTPVGVRAPTTAPGPNEFTQMQFNWSLFWGLAINLYEATLVSDQDPVDKFINGTGTLSASEQAGFTLFNNAGIRCSSCHLGAEMTAGSVSNVTAAGTVGATSDTGFANIGVRPTGDDAGNAGNDPFGGSLSEGNGTQAAGSFKIPDLRNVELTAPYFHNGDKLTLDQVVAFYAAGGDFANPEKQIQPIGGPGAENQAALVAFLKALTDPRVRNQSAPFDHPELFVPNGSVQPLSNDGQGRGLPNWILVPATGAAGGAPLAAFPNQGIPSTGPAPAVPPHAPAPAPVAVVKKANFNLKSMSILGKIKLRTAKTKGIKVVAALPTGAKLLRVRLAKVLPPAKGKSVQRQI